MKNGILQVLLAASLVYTITGCAAGPAPTGTVATPIPTSVPPSPTRARPTPTPTPQGRTIVVNSTADSGPGTLRQALSDAENGDTITFDSSVFAPNAPETIAVTTGLPQISQGHLTIDASDAGVILDGSQLPTDSGIPGLEIVSDGNTIRGLQVIHVTGTGIVVAGGRNNTIGGDPSIGLGPIGQGNLCSGNDGGIGLWAFASHNTVTGNLLGTDVSGTENLSNRRTGVWVTEGGTENVIGPDNIIAHNDKCGIGVNGSDSLDNTLTQNSIHDNGGPGICLLGGANTTLAAPKIFEFDLQAGSLAGWACPNCTVEIFSDNDDEGAAYEGQRVADNSGNFIFEKGAPITNAHVTLTATDSDGNTSAFSVPTSGASMSLILQEGNNLAKAGIVTGRLRELADNRIGDTFPLDRHPSPCAPAEEDWSFTHVSNLSLKWVRLSLDRLELDQARSMGDYSQFDINECQDEIVTSLAENDITILYTIVYWDENLHTENYPDYGHEQEVQRFLDYTRLIVRHFKDRIQYYEILNEAVAYVDVADYINLIRRVVPVIREEYPEAKIVVGGSSDLLSPDCHDYLFSVLRSDIMPLVDGIATHPMYGTSPQYDGIRQYYYDYPSLVQEIKDVASASGFTGEYLAEEMAWRTTVNPSPWERWEYTPIVAAKYYARGITMHLGMDLWAGIGGEMYDSIPSLVKVVQNLSASMAGTTPTSLTVNIESEATNIMSYGFILPNGEKLFALWTDGAAVEDDPGVQTTLTFPGLSAQEVTGIDVLNGFEQEMITDVEGGALVIHDLLVKDYPIILRLTS